MTMHVDEQTLRVALFERIDKNANGKCSMKVKTLMAEFGFSAEHRVRQASLEGVIDQLLGWGMTCAFSTEARSANDYVTIARAARSPGPGGRPPGPPPGFTPRREAPARVMSAPASAEATFNPLHFAFRFGDGASDQQSAGLAEQIVAHVWAFRPVCLAIEGDDVDLAFAGAVLGAVMRRRSLFLGPEAAQDLRPTNPEVVSVSTLGALVGRSSATGGPASVPSLSGSVILVRVDDDDVRADEVLALIRDVYVPHTYRARARGQDSLQGFSDWSAAFASAPRLSAGLLERLGRQHAASDARRVDLAAVMTEAAQVRDALFERACQRGIDPRFRAGFESTEHMTLKAAIQRFLVEIHGPAAVRVEQTYDTAEEEVDQPSALPRPPGLEAKTCRPDIRVEGKIWVEVETLRGRGMRMRDPFFDLERSMLRRFESAKPGEELWLLVPSDLAMLASRKFEVLARNLRSVRQDVTVCWGFVDLETDRPVMLRGSSEDGSPVDVELAGRSWRDRRPTSTASLGWQDVAGYEGVRQRLTEDVLDPLKNPERYRNHGLTSANGLLLYGLPGCGKSLIGRVLAGEAGVACKVLLPSDLTSMWLGEGVAKIREAFDWALDQQDGCLLVLDELDAVAQTRSVANMHSDERRQVNELLVQLDRLAKKPVIVVGTTNYMSGIDSAVRRSGRFDVKIPVYPPDRNDRKAIFQHYVKRLKDFEVSDVVDALDGFAERTPLFAPADVEAVVNLAARRAVWAACRDGSTPRLTALALRGIIEEHQRSIRKDAALSWAREARQELGARESSRLDALEREIAAAYPG